MKEILTSLDSLPLAIEELKSHIGNCKCLLFYGEIGAGKTTFIKAFCESLDVIDTATSPTFSIINEYHYFDTIAQQKRLIYHMDLYRLKNIQEAIDIGIEDYLYSGNYCLIEWPELIETLLPEDTAKIKFEILEDSVRKMLIS